MNFNYANELILREKKLELANGRKEETWYLFHNHMATKC